MILNQTKYSRAYSKGHRLFVSQMAGGKLRRYQFEPNVTDEMAEELKTLSCEELDVTVETVLALAQKLNVNAYYQAAV